mgnify:CR=1 FL=1
MRMLPSANSVRAVSNHDRLQPVERHPNAGQPANRPHMRTRKYNISYLSDEKQIVEFSRRAPAIAAFEDAFGALGHGAILQTGNGPMAIEDVLPGDAIRLSNGRYEKLLWCGSMPISPVDHDTNPDHGSLTRITADALGLNRPSPDVVLGPTARLLHRAPAIRKLTGKSSAFIPARDFFDGTNFVALRPATPVIVYEIGFARHCSLTVNGIEIESLHPGTAFALGLRGDLLTQYLGLFPHKRNFDDFGEMKNPRLRLRDLELLD